MFRDNTKRREYFNNRRKQTMVFLRLFKSQKSCSHCGYNEHSEILQFHHIDPSNKEFDFSKGNIGNLSKNRLLKEIEKCILLCPNCHIWLHYKENAK